MSETELSRRQMLEAAAALTAAGAAAAALTNPEAAGAAAPEAPTSPKSSQSNKFALSRLQPQVVRRGGSLRECREQQFPVLEGNAASAAMMHLEKGAIREPHWHPNAWEVDVPLSGKGRLGVINPDGTWSVQDLSQGDIAFIPKGFAHYIENVGSTPLRLVLVFNNSNFDNIGLSTTFEGTPTHVFTETFGLPRNGLSKARKPDTTEFIVN